MVEIGTELPHGFVAGNHFDKYRSRNPIYRALVGGFLRSAQGLVRVAAPTRVLEVGCGSGDLAARLFGMDSKQYIDYTGIDISQEEIVSANKHYPTGKFQVASAYDLPFPNRFFDLVVVCQVLEHLARPADCLCEVERVCNAHVLVSVPWEPVWRLLNVARGKYWRHLGNTPGHVQHFSRRDCHRLVTERFNLVLERRPFPWTMILARVRSDS
jgi:2-polyprenyl-3-methyl-5-hydroxy-6-metoxy-1,4-benzoquinol methylase